MWIVVVNTKYNPFVKEFETRQEANEYYKLINNDYLIEHQLGNELQEKYMAQVKRLDRLGVMIIR